MAHSLVTARNLTVDSKVFHCVFAHCNILQILPHHLSVPSVFLREEPFVFQIGGRQMNEGWEKGLLNMCVGEKRKLVVPSDLAYGEVGGYGSESINKIKPGATLVYDVELLGILYEDAAAPHSVWGL